MRISCNLRTISRWTNGSGKRAHACASRAISEPLVGGLTVQESEHVHTRKGGVGVTDMDNLFHQNHLVDSGSESFFSARRRGRTSVTPPPLSLTNAASTVHVCPRLASVPSQSRPKCPRPLRGPPHQNRPKYGCPRPLRGPPLSESSQIWVSTSVTWTPPTKASTVHVCPGN